MNWKPGGITLNRNDEGAAVEMAPGKPASNIEFLAYGESLFRSLDFQPYNPA